MSFRYLAATAAFVVIVGGGGSAQADTAPSNYRPGEYLRLDLQSSLLSPKRLGPTAMFEAYPIEARSDVVNAIDAAADETQPAAQRAAPVVKRRNVTRLATPPARNRVVRARSNPLDANASDTRIQTWPCRTGGICNWQRN